MSPRQAFCQTVQELLSILRPVSTAHFVFNDIRTDDPVAQCHRGVDHTVYSAGAFLMDPLDRLHQCGEIQSFSATLGGAAFCDGVFLLRGHGSVLRLAFSVAAEAVFDVVVQDEIQLLRREAVVLRQHPFDLPFLLAGFLR